MTIRRGSDIIAGTYNLDEYATKTDVQVNIDNLTTDLNGKANINLSNSTAITNCIIEIPQDIKLEVNNGTLTLKAGSKVYVPNGFESDGTTPKFDVVILQNDSIYSRVTGGSGRSLLFLYGDLSTLGMFTPSSEDAMLEYYFSGPTAPTVTLTYALWYDTTNNIIKDTDDNGTTWKSGNSLPLSICSYTAGTGATSIDQVFNGFGYIGSTVFALPGVKGLIPNGRNEDGSLKNTDFTKTNVLTRTLSSTGYYEYAQRLSGSLYQSRGFGLTQDNYLYDVESGENVNGFEVFSAVLESGRITSFTPKTAFHAVDRNDSSWLSSLGMPSSQYIDLTLGASGTSYTAPANGYISMVMGGTVSGNMGYFSQVYDNGIEIRRFGEQSSSGTYHVFTLNFEIKRRQTFSLSYYGTTPNFFRFIYAEGEN